MRHYGEGLKPANSIGSFSLPAPKQHCSQYSTATSKTSRKSMTTKANSPVHYSHLLRVYLIDTDKQIRNIYNVDFLHADTVINDVKTLLASPSRRRAAGSQSRNAISGR